MRKTFHKDLERVPWSQLNHLTLRRSWKLFGGVTEALIPITGVEETHDEKRWIFLTLNVECLEALRATSGYIGFGFTSIELRVYKKDSLAASKSVVANSIIETPSAPCEAEKPGKTPDEVLEPLEDELSLALSSLPLLVSEVTLPDMEDTNVTVLAVGETESSNAEGSTN